MTAIVTLKIDGDGPWTYGHPFARGDMPGWIGANWTQFQAEIRNRWDDGSVKFAVLSGIGGGSVSLYGTHVEPPPLPAVPEPACEWFCENVRVTIEGDGAGVYHPAPELMPWDRSKPHKVREILGPVMSEFHYYSPTSDAHLSVWWYVRCYANGAVEVETVLENGWLYVPGPTHKDYRATVTIAGHNTFNAQVGLPFWVNPVRKSDSVFRFPAASCRLNFPAGCRVSIGGSVYAVVSAAAVAGGTDVTVDGVLPAELGQVTILAHPHHTRWSRIDWIGAEGTRPVHDGEYLMGTPFVPRFYKGDGPPTDKAIAALLVPTQPFERGDWPRTVGASGSNSEPLRREAAHYVKWGIPRAWDSLVAHCSTAGRYPIIYRDEATGQPPRYGDYPLGAYAANAAILSTGVTSAAKRFPVGGVQPPVWKASHAPQTGYPGYIFTGRWTHLELMEFEAQSNWWVSNNRDNSFEGWRVANARSATFAPRGAGWAMRAMMQAACLPDEHPRQWQYVGHLEKTLAYYADAHAGKNALYMVQPNTGYAKHGINGENVTNSATFQQNFLSYGAGWALLLVGHLFVDPRAEAFALWRLHEPVARSGGTDYCWRDAAGSYVVEYAPAKVASNSGATPDEFNAACHTNWLDVYRRTFGVDPVDCEAENRLRGSGGGNPSILTKDPGSNWAIQQATIALAVDLGIDGATDAWARLTGAENWNPVGFRNLPDWGIVPRWH